MKKNLIAKLLGSNDGDDNDDVSILIETEWCHQARSLNFSNVSIYASLLANVTFVYVKHALERRHHVKRDFTTRQLGL